MPAQDDRTIYLDTVLWNRLTEQPTDAVQLSTRLSEHNARFALSAHAVYELARAFKSNPQKGCALFETLKKYVDAGISVVYDNYVQLESEVGTMKGLIPSVRVFYDAHDYASLQAEVDKLSRGVVDATATEFIDQRGLLAAASRTEQKEHTDRTPKTAQLLQAVSTDQLPLWLETEAASATGIRMLASHMERPFEGELPRSVAIDHARRLLARPGSRMARALVKADLYYNWRCANYGSVPRDLMPDLYHLVNAVYCDIYATAESKHGRLAPLVLTSKTSVAIYDESRPVGDWLVGLLTLSA